MTKLLKDMTWQEAKETFKTVKLGIIPTGSMEQHGHTCLWEQILLLPITWLKRYQKKLKL